jgi:hypothetical protein
MEKEEDQEVFSQGGALPQLSKVWGERGHLVCSWLITHGKLLSSDICTLGLEFAAGVIVPEIGLPVFR